MKSSSSSSARRFSAARAARSSSVSVSSAARFKRFCVRQRLEVALEEVPVDVVQGEVLDDVQGRVELARVPPQDPARLVLLVAVHHGAHGVQRDGV
jgi:hypothetical protein